MEISVQLKVAGEQWKEEFIHIQDDKVMELTDEELEAAVDIVVREWADRHISIEWEIKEDPR